ncbi:Predicted dithiol-disulfide isomerase, DsbA family [Singulisphaera sp. GP187]|uniref:DsbA family oxidoreductase n=1 Tax=Singulisphaera sp. GP187 TaxID=1882752 RepID=UPI0009269BB7|nr:DsbA family oxidoreductase [Singulisphaera sp. GP187]SIO65003.1 Predicted dithiol-disulfide isomerase, DsbA family [Singulisphaera sp. GP187]
MRAGSTMLTIDVISDVICPWCFIGKRRLEKALGDRPAIIRWHPFQLNPDMPREGIERKAYRIKKFGSWERSQELDAQVATAGHGEGIAFNFDRMARTPNTLDAHRVICLAGERGIQDAVVEALFVAYFTEGLDLSDRATLAELAPGAGLERTEVDELLASDKGLDIVRAGEEQARHLGVSGVPFFVVNGQVALSGAQPPELFLQAFEQVAEAVAAREACEGDSGAGKRGC